MIPSHSCGVKISGTSVTVRVNTIFSPGRITGCSARIRAASISAERLTGDVYKRQLPSRARNVRSMLGESARHHAVEISFTDGSLPLMASCSRLKRST